MDSLSLDNPFMATEENSPSACVEELIIRYNMENEGDEWLHCPTYNLESYKDKICVATIVAGHTCWTSNDEKGKEEEERKEQQFFSESKGVRESVVN